MRRNLSNKLAWAFALILRFGTFESTDRSAWLFNEQESGLSCLRMILKPDEAFEMFVHEPNYLSLYLVRFSVSQLRVADDIRVLYLGKHPWLTERDEDTFLLVAREPPHVSLLYDLSRLGSREKGIKSIFVIWNENFFALYCRGWKFPQHARCQNVWANQ